MNDKSIDFDSFSPFWICIKSDGVIVNYSFYFKKFLSEHKSIFDSFSFKRMFIRDKSDLYRQFERKILDFELTPIELGFRGNLHKFDDLAVIIAWPKLRDIKDIKTYNLHVEMSHPCCILTDLLITKDLLKKSQEKINKIELQKVESKLFENQERTKNILKNMIEGVWVQDSYGNVIECNPAALKILDIQKSELFKMNSSVIERKIFIDADGESYSFDWIVSQFKKAPIQNLLVSFKCKNENKKWIRLNCSKFESESNSFYLTTLQDVTSNILKEKELETQKEMAHHNAKLASIGELAAGVGHEINNPLAVISGQVSIIEKIIKQPVDSKEIVEKLQKINKAISRINNITKGLKTFSRADTSEISDFNISELVEDTLDMYREILGSDSIKVCETIDPNLWVNGNYGRVQQVLVNLLNNAKDALINTDNKIIDINVKRNKNNVTINVKDSGTGIPVDVRTKIFEPFFTTKDVNKGTGIGLALVNSIIKEHKGEIYVESELNEWTKFVITFPLIEQSEIHKNDEVISISNNVFEVKKEKSINDQKVTYGGKVLILDDEEGIREVLKELLTSEGHDVITVKNGKEGLEAFEEYKNEIYIIISDIKMPDVDGPNFLKAIREKHNYDGRFYFITGGVNLDISNLEKSVDGIIMKPFDYDEIFELINESQKSA